MMLVQTESCAGSFRHTSRATSLSEGGFLLTPLYHKSAEKTSSLPKFVCRGDHWSPVFCGWLRAINDRPYEEPKHPYENLPKLSLFTLTQRNSLSLSMLSSSYLIIFFARASASSEQEEFSFSRTSFVVSVMPIVAPCIIISAI